jgi:hypothetical protein
LTINNLFEPYLVELNEKIHNYKLLMKFEREMGQKEIEAKSKGVNA